VTLDCKSPETVWFGEEEKKCVFLLPLKNLLWDKLRDYTISRVKSTLGIRKKENNSMTLGKMSPVIFLQTSGREEE
jgi:hypothetical protein